jgi:hypothetical protein
MILARTNDDIQWAKRIGQPLDLSPVPNADLLAELERRQAKRKVHRGGPGRPRKPRRPCGRFAQDAARKKGHVCKPEGVA